MEWFGNEVLFHIFAGTKYRLGPGRPKSAGFGFTRLSIHVEPSQLSSFFEVQIASFSVSSQLPFWSSTTIQAFMILLIGFILTSDSLLFPFCNLFLHIYIRAARYRG